MHKIQSSHFWLKVVQQGCMNILKQCVQQLIFLLVVKLCCKCSSSRRADSFLHFIRYCRPNGQTRELHYCRNTSEMHCLLPERFGISILHYFFMICVKKSYKCNENPTKFLEKTKSAPFPFFSCAKGHHGVLAARTYDLNSSNLLSNLSQFVNEKQGTSFTDVAIFIFNAKVPISQCILDIGLSKTMLT